MIEMDLLLQVMIEMDLLLLLVVLRTSLWNSITMLSSCEQTVEAWYRPTLLSSSADRRQALMKLILLLSRLRMRSAEAFGCWECLYSLFGTVK